MQCNCINQHKALIIKEIYCQNGTPNIKYKTISNIDIGEEVSLNFGYTLSISNYNINNIKLILNDSTFGFGSQVLTLSNKSYLMVSLPARNGTYRIYFILV